LISKKQATRLLRYCHKEGLLQSNEKLDIIDGESLVAALNSLGRGRIPEGIDAQMRFNSGLIHK
jgi:hypothetical protein